MKVWNWVSSRDSGHHSLSDSPLSFSHLLQFHEPPLFHFNGPLIGGWPAGQGP